MTDTAQEVYPESRSANPYSREVAADPIPFYDRLRAECPVANMLGMEAGTHIISRYDDVKFALRHPEIFSSDLVAVDIGQDRPLIPLQVDPPAHAKYRRVLDPQLGPREIAHLEPEIRAIATATIDRFIERGACDFHEEFSVSFPCTVFLAMTGLPLEDLDQLLRWKDNIIRPGTMDMEKDAEIRKTTGAAMYAYFEKAIDARAAEPTDDILSRFQRAEIDGQVMSREEMLDVCYLFILGGLDTVTSTLDCSIAYLAQHPNRRAPIVADLNTVPAAVEELLRLHTPVMQVLRVVAQPYEMHGVSMQPGDHVVVMLGSADTDPDEFGVDAGEFTLDRETNRHLAFGGGPHRCLGSHLARLELRVAMEEVHRRLPDYAVVEGAELVYSPGIREIERLPLVFTPAERERP